MDEKSRVLILGDAADDLVDLLTQEECELLQVGSLQEAQDVSSIDLVICDTRDGEADLSRCVPSDQTASLPYLAVVSSCNLAEQAISVGFDDIIIEPFDPQELALRARMLMRRTRPEAVRSGLLVINPTMRQVRQWSEEIELTRLEYGVLNYLLENAPRVIEYDELLTQVWNHNHPVGGAETAKACVKRLRAKIEPDPSQPRYIITVRGVGYRWGASVTTTFLPDK